VRSGGIVPHIMNFYARYWRVIRIYITAGLSPSEELPVLTAKGVGWFPEPV
jgi:hypothetical protein